MGGQWIWKKEQGTGENERVCFYTEFDAEAATVTIHICAVTRYILYLNGEEIGRGPIRSGVSELYYDSYHVVDGLRVSHNQLAVRVWDYGLSTYQTIYQKPGLWFEAVSGGKLVCCSDEKVSVCTDYGHISHTVKRNVNLGFGEGFDARKFDSRWIADKAMSEAWQHAACISEYRGKLLENPIKQFHTQNIWPQSVLRVQNVLKGCRQISVNTRHVFFGERRDADETIFSAFLGGVIKCPKDMDGEIEFPNRTWNGVLGDFRIGQAIYEVSNERRVIPIRVKCGQHLFLMQISGKYDDLYCHMEWRFPEEIQFVEQNHTPFFAIGPTRVIRTVIDGEAPVYGGLNEYNRMNEYSALHEEIWRCSSLEALGKTGAAMLPVQKEDIYWDEYVYSNVKNDKVVTDSTVLPQHQGLLWQNQEETVLAASDGGADRRIIIDFGDVYVGSPEFTLFAPEGTLMEVYGFENMYQGEIDFTVGLNNSLRYICREGWQSYRSMVRMGMRFAVITFRDCTGEIRIRDFHLRHSTYPPGLMGKFSCNDQLLNKIWDMCYHTHVLCNEDSFTDSPTYEQAFWIGDAGISSLVHAYLFCDYEYIRHNIRLAVSARENTELFNALTPTDWNTSIPLWTMNWMISIEDYYNCTADTAFIKEIYPEVEKTLLHYAKFVREDGSFLINAWNMVDWADMDIHNYGVVTAQEGVLAHCFEIGICLAEAAGIEKKALFAQCRDKMLYHIDTALWDSGRKMFLDGWAPGYGKSKTVSIQTHALLYLYNAITDHNKKKIVEAYLEKRPSAFVLEGSPFMLHYLYEIKARKGGIQQVLNDIKVKWGRMLDYDSTTCWEVFPGFYEVSRTRSYCHSWSASPAYFMIRYLLGIEETDKGFREIRISLPDTELKWCRGTLPTPHGMIHVEWDKKEGGRYSIRLPEGIRYKVKEDFPLKLSMERQKTVPGYCSDRDEHSAARHWSR